MAQTKAQRSAAAKKAAATRKRNAASGRAAKGRSSARAPADAVSIVRDKELGAGAWSYFGDPRAISHEGDTFLGWISTSGNVWVAHLTAEGQLTKKVIFRGLGRDDHNNPSLVFLPDGRIAVFFSPHSGHVLPPPGIPSVMRYVISKHAYSIDGFGAVRKVPTNARGDLGYTYPNPIQQRGKLWLFWRGGRWNPTFSYTENNRDWVPARELVFFDNVERPYTKYVGDGNRRIHGIFSDGHAGQVDNSLHYLRYEAEGLFAASGRKLGSLKDVPLHTSKLDHVYKFTKRGGSAWPHDIALDADGNPFIVYTRRVARRDTFYYAHFDGMKWVSHKIVEAGRRGGSFTSGGATLNHDDPRVVYLSRTIGKWHQVEEWTTTNNGRTWTTRQLTDAPNGYSIRPARPRGLTEFNRVVYVRGDERTIGFADFRSRVRAVDFEA